MSKVNLPPDAQDALRAGLRALGQLGARAVAAAADSVIGDFRKTIRKADERLKFAQGVARSRRPRDERDDDDDGHY